MDADLLFDDKLGEATTDDDGRFVVRYGTERFRDLFERAPDVYVLIHDERGRQLATTLDAVVRNAGPEQEMHVQLAGNGIRPPARTVYVGGLAVSKEAFESLAPEDVLEVGRNAFKKEPEERALAILEGLHPSLADDLRRPKLCGTPVTSVLEDLVRAKKWDREIALTLEDILWGFGGFGFTSYSCPPFSINYETTGSTAVDPTDTASNITLPGAATVLGSTAANGVPDYIERICFWLQRAYQAFTDPPFGLSSPTGTITVDVIDDPGYGHGGLNHITIHYNLPNDLLAWVLVHELMHVFQAEYVANGTGGGWNPGMTEGGAVLAEDTVLDLINRYAGEADTFFGEGTLLHPEYSLQGLSYKLSLFLKYLTEQQSAEVQPPDEPRVGVDAYRRLLETFDAQSYTTAAFEQAVADLPWYQSFFKFGYLDAAKLDETSSETLLGNFWLACYVKDLGVGIPDRRFDFMEDEDVSLADDIFPGGSPVPIGTLRSVAFQGDVALPNGGAVTLSSGSGGTVSPFAARFYKVSPAMGVNTLRVNFSAGAGFTRPLVQIVLVEPGNTVRDILRSDRTVWARTIANNRSGTRLDHLVIIVAGTDTGGPFTLSVQDVPQAPDVMVTRWHHPAGTGFEIDSFNWAWTWVSPDIFVDTNLDGVADDQVVFDQNNKLFVRLRNQGNAPASNIQVEFWYQDASGGLDPSAWQPVRNQTGDIQVLTGLSLPPQSTSPIPPAPAANQWSVDWAPAPSGGSHHFCVRAVVTVPGDPNTDNKRCVSNFGNVIMGGGFADLDWVRRAYLERYPEVEVVVIPRAHGRSVVSRADIARINATKVPLDDDVLDQLRVRALDVRDEIGPEPEAEGDEHTDGQALGIWPRPSRLGKLPDLRGHYPSDPRTLPPGLAEADLITVAHLVQGRPIGGFTWALHAPPAGQEAGARGT